MIKANDSMKFNLSYYTTESMDNLRTINEEVEAKNVAAIKRRFYKMANLKGTVTIYDIENKKFYYYKPMNHLRRALNNPVN